MLESMCIFSTDELKILIHLGLVLSIPNRSTSIFNWLTQSSISTYDIMQFGKASVTEQLRKQKQAVVAAFASRACS